jgi:3-oxoacyl-[acyl-carrier protein] reductase
MSFSDGLGNKVAVVSGSSSGIGAAVARELSRRGAHVVINYPYASERANAEAVLDSLPGKNTKSIIVEADLSTESGPSHLANAAADEFGRIDILINNAGLGLFCPLDGGDDWELLEMWNTVINLNARGTMLLTRAALKHLSRQNSRIINICSSTSRNPEYNMTIYAGSKGMIESFTRCWARELPRKYGCTVNTVAPGPVATPQMLNGPTSIIDSVSSQFSNVPVAPRMAKPEEIAWTVATLCEEGAGWLNGLYVPVTGGQTLC